MKTVGLHFRKWDLAAVAGVVLAAAVVFACYLPAKSEPAAYARIYLQGELIRTVSLAEDQIFTVEGAYCNTVEVRDGKIAICRSDCPGEDCVACGWLDGTGRSIVCLPNGLEIRVVGARDDVDFVVG